MDMDNSCDDNIVFDLYEEFGYETQPSEEPSEKPSEEPSEEPSESCESEIVSNVVNNEDVDDLRNFIESYETMPKLWNPTNPNYINKTKRNNALDKLLIIYKKIKPTANRADVRRKINTLRTNYRKELKKILISKRSGNGTDEVYTPTSYVFLALQFLDKFEQPVNENVQQINKSSRSDSTGNRERSPIQVPSASRSSIMAAPTPKSQRYKQRTTQTATHNELLQKACKFLDNNICAQKLEAENIRTICKAWGEKLLTLEPNQRNLVEKGINDIFFEASLGSLHRDSIKINDDGRNWAIRSPSLNSSKAATSQSVSPICEEQPPKLIDFFSNFKV